MTLGTKKIFLYYYKSIINLKEPMCVIASEAIHQNSSANTNLDLNIQIDLIPIISLNKENYYCY